MHGHGHETVRLGNRLAANHLLPCPHDGNGRFAEVLGERDDQNGREGKTSNRQVAGLILVLGRMNTMAEGIPLHQRQHVDAPPGRPS